MTTEKSPAEILRAAADLIGGAGCWMQGEHTDGLGSFSLIGAVYWASRGGAAAGFLLCGAEPSPTQAEYRAIRAIERAIPVRGGLQGVIDWNDHAGRTQEEAIELLEAAAQLAEAKS